MPLLVSTRNRANALPMGLWSDGAPCKWHRSESLEVFALNLPGPTGDLKRLRLLLTGLSNKNVSTNTFAGVFGCRRVVVPMSSRQTISVASTRRGTHGFETCKVGRPDAGSDWKFMKDTFGFPGWNTNSGICCLCDCTPQTLRDVGHDAPWRVNRRSHWYLLAHVTRGGNGISPILGAPWLRSSCFRIDWLHRSDQRAAPDFMDGVFFHVIKGTCVPGTNRRERCSGPWERIQGFYRQRRVTDRTSNLTVTISRRMALPSPNFAARLRSAEHSCHFWWSWRDDLLGEAVTVAARSLLDCHVALSSDSVFAKDVLRGSSVKFAQQLVVLESVDPGCWGPKQNLHLWLELGRAGTKTLERRAHALARRRGGHLNATATSRVLLDRFLIMVLVPRR